MDKQNLKEKILLKCDALHALLTRQGRELAKIWTAKFALIDQSREMAGIEKNMDEYIK